MIVRLILAMILALAAMPAAPGACHGAASGQGMAIQAMPMTHHAPAPATPAHACIGCIPPGDWLGARIATPPTIASPQPASPIRTLDLGRSIPPALPPPRRG